jgi:hypothetical protein
MSPVQGGQNLFQDDGLSIDRRRRRRHGNNERADGAAGIAAVSCRIISGATEDEDYEYVQGRHSVW